jgi:RIO-like serine/threonine protein kinase
MSRWKNVPKIDDENYPVIARVGGVHWTDVSITETEPLPPLPDSCVFSNPQHLKTTLHSHIYRCKLDYEDDSYDTIIKLFPKGHKKFYTNEVNSYRLLYHFDVPAERIVPQIYGIIPTVNKKLLKKMLQDSIPEDAPISLPASAVVMEFIDGESPSRENMTPKLAKRILYGLQCINEAHILHHDAFARNILVLPAEERAVWIDFSSAALNTSISLSVQERDPLKVFLFRDLVIIPKSFLTGLVENPFT